MTGVSLSGAHGLHPQRGEVVWVEVGSMLVFVEHPDGLRLPFATLAAGTVAVGCAATPDGRRLFLTGMPGTKVRTLDVAEVLATRGKSDVEGWISAVGDAARGETWVERVIAPAEQPLRLAPGEHVVATTEPASPEDRSVLGWLRVVAGGARWCGWSQATIGTRDGAIPITRGAWLTSGLHTRIAAVPAPPVEDVDTWIDALDVIGQLGIAAIGQRQTTDDKARAARLADGADAAAREMTAGVVALSGAFEHAGSTSAAPPAELGAIWWVAHEVGLDTDDAALQRAESLCARGVAPLQAVAQACGARVRTVRLPSRWWRQEGPPLVGCHDQHGMVALHWHRGDWLMAWPAVQTSERRTTPEVAKVDAASAAAISEEATQLVALLPSSPTSTSRLLRLAITKVWSDAAGALLMSALIAIAAFATPYVLGQIAGNLADITIWHLLGLLGALVLLEIAINLWRGARGLNLIRTRTRAVSAAAMAVWDRMIRLPARWHADRPLGQRLVALSAPNLASNALPNTTVNALLDSGAVIGGLAAVATTTPALFFAISLVVLAQAWVGVILVRRQAAQARVRVIAGAKANGRLIETLRGVNTLRLFGAQSRAFRRWAQTQSVLAAADVTLRQLGTVQMVFTAAWPIVGLILVVAVSAASSADFGQFVTAQTAASLMSMAVAAATLAAGATTTARAQFSEVTDLLATQPEQPGLGESPGTLNGAIAVTDLAFRYHPEGPRVLDGVTLQVAPGEHVAIVGQSGCGKTTLVRVLLGLETPTSGVITFDGRDLATLDQPALRRQIGTVLQSADLLAGSIRENIDMGRNLTTAEIWAALDAAAIGEDVRALPLGLETTVIDGNSSMSGGQRQRILIARALAGEPRMLVFDEATSALDNVTQHAVVASLSQLRLTRIVVAHRLSTVRRADRIVVLGRGRVVQQGSYEELIAQPGAFRDLAMRQLT